MCIFVLLPVCVLYPSIFTDYKNIITICIQISVGTWLLIAYNIFIQLKKQL